MKHKATIRRWCSGFELVVSQKYVNKIRTYRYENVDYKLVRRYIRDLRAGFVSKDDEIKIFSSVVESEYAKSIRRYK